MSWLFFILAFAHASVFLWQTWTILTYSPGRQANQLPTVSVVIAARNELKHLKELIPAIMQQDYPHFEVIVALDRCTDSSESYLKTVNFPGKLKVLSIPSVPEGIHGKKHALTRAIEESTGEWIFLTDADCRPASNKWIRSLSLHIDDDTQLLVGVSPYYQRSGLLSACVEYETLKTAISYLASGIRGNPYMGVGRNMGYKRTLFIDNQGFIPHQGVTGGDDDLFVQKHATAYNTKMVLGVESLTYSAPKRKWKEYLSQKLRHLSVGKYYRSELKQSHIIEMSIHLMLWVSFLYLSINYPPDWRIIGVFGALVVVKGVFFTRIAQKAGMSYRVQWFPVADFLHAVFMPLIGMQAVFVKEIRWKK